MMNKEIYKTAMNKIKVGENFQVKLVSSIKNKQPNRSLSLVRLLPALVVLSLVAYVGVTQMPTLLNKQDIHNPPNLVSSKTEKPNVINEETNEFEVVKEIDVEASYISVVYLNGYAYEPSKWYQYSMRLSDSTDYEALKGKKLGEVTLDLKGKKYTGLPPDFSSTYDVGTEIYEIKNINPSSAILVNFDGSYEIFYRRQKSVESIYEPLNLLLSDVFDMLSENSEIVSVELRDEENGAWMATSKDENLLAILNNELPGLSLLNYGEIDNEHYSANYRIPINLIFSDGRALHMQVYALLEGPGWAYTFGGFVPISKEMEAAVQTLYDKGSPYPRLVDLIPYVEEEITYLYLKDHVKGDEVVCEEPAWSRSDLLHTLSYYRSEKTEAGNSNLVLTAILGRSGDDNITVNFYETSEQQILTEINGEYYKPVRGQLLSKNLDNYLTNYTELGLK
jgi:hypothetical protein